MLHLKDVRSDSMKISMQRQKLLTNILDIEIKPHQTKLWYVVLINGQFYAQDTTVNPLWNRLRSTW